MFPLFGKKKDPPEASTSPPAQAGGLAAFLKKDLELTRQRWSKAINVLRAAPRIDEALSEQLASQLLEADVGVAATHDLIERLRRAQREKRLEDGNALAVELKEALVAVLQPLEKPAPFTPASRIT